ncbi:hypothetical protein [uncultured Psychroserpens sp.]|uniref:hypothetical protein n=1 Tax=uncultured Psychroserpens sp. TaxID=255436 RepID=UPI00262DAC56|nr:hypothetical protein [uncultured Psychroserpens sp.]
MIYILIIVTFILIVQSQNIIRYFRNEKRGWKFYKKNHKKIIYSEKIKGTWKHIEIDAEIDYGTFVPCFKNEENWTDYPDWAQNRNVIMDRIKEKFPLKD